MNIKDNDLHKIANNIFTEYVFSKLQYLINNHSNAVIGSWPI
jgi:hypothetical protein